MATTLILTEPQYSHEDRAYDVYVDNEHVGRVARQRHTVRTPYKGTRIGYDQTHTCWWGEFNYGKRPEWFRSDSLRCYTSRKQVVDLMSEAG